MSDRFCCYFDSVKHVACEKPAGFGIYHECDGLECTTDACEEHVGPLLGCNSEPPQTDKAWRVVPLREGCEHG